MSHTSYNLEDLLTLMQILRDPKVGCPWDIKQNYQTIAACTIEEAYEVVDAIEKKDYVHLEEELGDLLFQVVFYSQLGREDTFFDFHTIVNTLTDKLIRRHPHVFPSGNLHADLSKEQTAISSEAVKENWEKLKQQERLEKGSEGILDDVPTGLPALTRATKLQKRAAKVGFDWSNTKQILAKLREEIEELEHELEVDATSEKTKDELGDVFFTAVNLARFLKVDSESIVRQANQKFEKRFNYIQAHSDKPLEQTSLENMQHLWEKSKLI